MESNFLKLELKKTRLTFGKVVTFDTEAYKIPIDETKYRFEFRNADFFDGKRHYYTEKKEEVPEIIEYLIYEYTEKRKRYKKVTVLAHNLLFDLRVAGLSKIIWERKFLDHVMVDKPRVDTIVYLKFDRVQFIDSFNWFKMSEREMGKQLGLPKILTEKEYNLPPEKWNPLIREKGKEVVQRDTEILYLYFEKFRKSKEFNIGVSIADTSLRTYQSRFMPITTISMPKKLEPYASESYRGGRTEAYYIEDPVPLKYYDINSLYPYVMKVNRFSVLFYMGYEHISPELIEKEKDNFNFLVNCDIEFPKTLPRLPIVYKVPINGNKKLTQKYTLKNVWLTGAEVLEAVKEGANVSIHTAYQFVNMDLFSKFVDYFYSKRLEYKRKVKEAKDEKERVEAEVMQAFFKLILNSLYGKFGQRKAHVEILTEGEIFELVKERAENEGLFRVIIGDKSGKKRVYTYHGDFVSYRNHDEEKAKYPIIIASEITAFARLYNYQWQKKIGFDCVYYTDTDSFMVCESAKVPTGDNLGELKRENEDIPFVLIHDPKDYELLDENLQPAKDENGLPKRKLKGIPRDAEEVNEYYQFWQISTLLSSKNPDEIVVELKKKTVHRKHDKLNYKKVEGYKGLWGFPLE